MWDGDFYQYKTCAKCQAISYSVMDLVREDEPFAPSEVFPAFGHLYSWLMDCCRYDGLFYRRLINREIDIEHLSKYLDIEWDYE